MALDSKNLLVRSLSGLVYIGLIIGAIIIGPLGVAFLSSFFAVVALYELENNVNARKDGDSGSWMLTWTYDSIMTLCLIWACAGILYFPVSIGLLFWVILLIGRFIIQIFIIQPEPVKSISTSMFAQFYIALPLTLLVVCSNLTMAHPWVLICGIAMIWVNDTGAYLIGSTLGRHKMFPRLSPKKSWEGFLGGLVFNIGVAFIYFYCFHLDQYLFISSVDGWIYIGMCVTVLATLGDLFESMIKRSLGIKDSGNIIPGHGGILDRIDSLLFVVPGILILLMVSYSMFNV